MTWSCDSQFSMLHTTPQSCTNAGRKLFSANMAHLAKVNCKNELWDLNLGQTCHLVLV